MEDNVSKIKDRLDVVDVISGYLKLQKTGINFKARCPFHNEKTPSFVVSPERQVWHCFGCSKGGDIFSFIQDIEGVEFPEALRILAAKAGIELESFNPAVKDDKARLYQVCESATKFFEKQFQSNIGKLALGYLRDRGVADSTIQEFRLGFAPNDWNALGTFLKNCGYSENEIVGAGLAIKRSDGSGVYDRFRSRITFPISDLNGQVVGFTGRIFAVPTPKGVGTPTESVGAKYINTPQTRIYDKSRVLYGLHMAKMDIKQADQCVLVEGNMDALMSHQAGIKNVVASSGTALTPNHLALLHRYTTNLGFCFDTDQAGAIATRRGIGLALSQNFNIKVVEINDKERKDPADLIKKSDLNPDASVGTSWSDAVGQAKPVLEFYFDKAKTGFDPDSANSKKSVISVLAPFLKRLTSQVEKAHWLARLAFLLRVKEEAIEDDINTAKDDLEAYDREPVLVKSSTDSVEVKGIIATTDLLNETLLSLVMKDPIFLKDSKDEELKLEFNNLINKLEERHLRTRLEKIGFEIRAGDDKDKKLALATEANKILNRLGEIQR